MKVFLLAVLGALVVAGLGWLLLSQAQTQSAVKYSTESVRLGDPGHNLLLGGDAGRSEAAAKSQKRAERD